MRTTILALAMAVLVIPTSARAFCGFYVASSDTQLFNEATTVVLLRSGTTTVLSMQNDYQGPAEDFAMVVPVPTVLHEENVRTLPRDLFERVDHLASPRLVEYWERDPCDRSISLGTLGTIGHGAGGGSGSGYGRGAGPPLVTVEAEFAVGEYDIVILGARDSGALDAWLHDHHYRIPEGAEPVLRPYVAAGMKFFVARVDPRRVTFEAGRAVLSPLRVHYTSEEFSLPVRLGLLNSRGTQDLIVHVLAENQRYEVANYENVTIPTNLDVQDSVRDRFGEFYAALFDATLERNPGAVVTEYAWQATSCDPCPGPVLAASDIATLGADVTHPSAQAPAPGLLGGGGTVPMVQPGSPTVSPGLSTEVVRRVLRRHLNEVRFCYEQQLAGSPSLSGNVLVDFAIDAEGHVPRATIATTTLGNAAAEACIATAFQRWAFPRPESSAEVTVRVPLSLTVGPSRFGGGGYGGSPFGGGPFGAFVLTRLHYRYGSNDLGEDLVFRAADPIVGGRERLSAEGTLEQGASPDSMNNFQGRYAIRHAWEGAVECESPTRGIWGGPPAGTEAPTAAAATNLARVTRGQIALASTLVSPLPSLGVGSTTAPAEPEAAEAEAEPAGESEGPVTPTTDVAPGGCGCRVGTDGAPGALWLAALALAVLAARRRTA